MTTDGDLAAVFDEWAVWEKNRRIYAPSPHVQSIIGSLVGPRGHDRPDAKLDSLMPFLHIAVASSEEHGPLIIAFHLKRRHGKRDPIKRLAMALGISRAQFYRKLPIARQVIHSTAERIREADLKGLENQCVLAEID